MNLRIRLDKRTQHVKTKTMLLTTQSKVLIARVVKDRSPRLPHQFMKIGFTVSNHQSSIDFCPRIQSKRDKTQQMHATQHTSNAVELPIAV